MGSLHSGSRRHRGGRVPVNGIPRVSMTYSTLGAITGTQRTRVVVETASWATAHHGVQSWPVQLESTALHFGGIRRWLVCPNCATRRQALYVIKDQLACRECLRLRYDSQHDSARDGLIRQINVLRDRLGWSRGPLGPFGDKPRYMHWQTYARHTARIHTLTNALLGNLNAFAEKLESQKADRVE